MTARLTTTVSKIEKAVLNKENVETILQFFEFMKKTGTSERYQNNNLKAIIAYCKFLGPSISVDQVKGKSQITSFLDTKIKTIEEDPDKRWITTWNDYLERIKYFFRWFHNYEDMRFDDVRKWNHRWKVTKFIIHTGSAIFWTRARSQEFRYMMFET